MKVELYPEDMLLSYVEKLLKGAINPSVEGNLYINELPKEIEFSEEFFDKWQTMVKSAIQRFFLSTFGLRKFLFDVDGYTKRFAVTDQQFWQNVDLKFSHRSAQRLYELMLFPVQKVEPSFHLVLPADAILVSICLQDFSQYSFEWLQKNSANWLVKAVFMTWQNAQITNLPWRKLLSKPSEVELPLRDYIIEKAADYLAACTLYLSGSMKTTSLHTPRKYTAEKAGGLEIFVNQPVEINKNSLDYVLELIAEVRSAISLWTGKGTTNIDDERFIAGAAEIFGFDKEVAEYSRCAEIYRESIELKEAIHESVLCNKTST
ncbi:MAG: hypothetical protein HQM10_03405 [Candidatus Riflebacteria bacterium]|nr:hypothetical protein [Candidatus Riflebacteria bacterium]